MEYVEGEQLFDVIAKRAETKGTFAEYETAVIMKKLLQTVEYCHSQNIIHKDIKPKKILVTSDGEIKLIDFGLAKWTAYGKLRTTIGTPYYLAPEVLKNIKTTKSDIWSLGVLLYCLLSGFLPFVSDAQESIFEKAMEGKYTFDHKAFDNVSRSAQDLISKMININYHNRYSASECLAHEWFIEALSEETKSQSSNFCDLIPTNLHNFKKKCELQNAAAKLIDQKISSKEIQQLKHKFESLSDGDGQITGDNFIKCISEL